MPRVSGDNNLSPREKRKDAQIAALKADLLAQKARIKVVEARAKELREKIKPVKVK